MQDKKSQAALEFLVTYSWAFLTILITVSTLYYFGIFDFGKFIPEKCIFTSQLECINFVIRGDQSGDENDIIIKLTNNLGEQINVDAVSITNDAIPSLNCVSPTSGPSWDRNWDAGVEKEFVFTSCAAGNFIVGERIDAIVTLVYFSPLTNPPNQPRHTLIGKIQGRVQ